MNITQNTVAKLTYELLDKQTGKLIEMINPEQPQEFLFGSGLLIEGFEENLNGLKSGDHFEFTITPAQAYGERDENAVMEIPKDTFEVDGVLDEQTIRIGNQIPMRDNFGNQHLGMVVDHQEDHIVMDFNHPLAGRELLFKGQILEVREATQEELDSLNGCGCGNSCGCGGHGHSHEHEDGENCGVCGNPPELQGQGVGNCKCG